METTETPKQALLAVPVHSVLPPITNSSSELFVMETQRTVDETRAFLDEVWNLNKEVAELVGGYSSSLPVTHHKENLFPSQFDPAGVLVNVRFEPPAGFNEMFQEWKNYLLVTMKVPDKEECSIAQWIYRLASTAFMHYFDYKSKRHGKDLSVMDIAKVRMSEQYRINILKARTAAMGTPQSDAQLLSVFKSLQEFGDALKEIITRHAANFDYTSSTVPSDVDWRGWWDILLSLTRNEAEEYGGIRNCCLREDCIKLIILLDGIDRNSTLEQYLEYVIENESHYREYWGAVRTVGDPGDRRTDVDFYGFNVSASGASEDDCESLLQTFHSYVFLGLFKDEPWLKGPMEKRFVCFGSSDENSVDYTMMNTLRSLHPSIHLYHAG